MKMDVLGKVFAQAEGDMSEAEMHSEVAADVSRGWCSAANNIWLQANTQAELTQGCKLLSTIFMAWSCFYFENRLRLPVHAARRRLSCLGSCSIRRLCVCTSGVHSPFSLGLASLFAPCRCDVYIHIRVHVHIHVYSVCVCSYIHVSRQSSMF